MYLRLHDYWSRKKPFAEFRYDLNVGEQEAVKFIRKFWETRSVSSVYPYGDRKTKKKGGKKERAESLG